ncbi:MAG: Smr/MutS family protein [Hyphomicrobiales bacterium]|nr:Smr/MutS family protein [Hyphomicrobiales bacterium]MDE2018519.1 Smr/MutS family protein [Hyphomicrobiales bacterium]
MRDLDPPRPRRLRRLSDEELRLWAEVARTVAPSAGRVAPTLPPAAPELASPAAAKPASGDAAPIAARSAPPLAPIEEGLRRRLRRGRAEIDAALDLHGMTQARAHARLGEFLEGARARGARIALVITGKGAPGAGESVASFGDAPGVLRRQVPHWLRAPELRAIVLGFEEAGPGHGGGGALYVRLRRAR